MFKWWELRVYHIGLKSLIDTQLGCNQVTVHIICIIFIFIKLFNDPLCLMAVGLVSLKIPLLLGSEGWGDQRQGLSNDLQWSFPLQAPSTFKLCQQNGPAASLNTGVSFNLSLVHILERNLDPNFFLNSYKTNIYYCYYILCVCLSICLTGGKGLVKGFKNSKLLFIIRQLSPGSFNVTVNLLRGPLI